MAKQNAFPAKGIELGEITPDAYYHLEMLLPHTMGRLKYSPLNSYKVKGYILSQIPEFKIKSAEML